MEEYTLPDPIVVIDDTPPLTKITYPFEKYITNSSFNIVGETEDDFSVQKVLLSFTNYNGFECMDEFFEIGELLNEGYSSFFNWEYENWKFKKDGIYCLKARGVDLEGNVEKTSVVENVMYDTQSPNIVFFEIVDGILKVEAEDELSGLKSIEFRIGDGDFKEYSEDFDLKSILEPGEYVVFVRVRDVAGNEEIQEKEFEIGEVLGITEEKEELPETGQAIFPFILIAVMLSMSYLFLRGPKRRKPKP